jgi:hypothetical protein
MSLHKHHLFNVVVHTQSEDQWDHWHMCALRFAVLVARMDRAHCEWKDEGRSESTCDNLTSQYLNIPASLDGFERSDSKIAYDCRRPDD